MTKYFYKKIKTWKEARGQEKAVFEDDPPWE